MPDAHAAPRLLVAAEDLAWFELSAAEERIATLVDGVQTIAQIARKAGVALVEAQVAIASLRERGIVGVVT